MNILGSNLHAVGAACGLLSLTLATLSAIAQESRSGTAAGVDSSNQFTTMDTNKDGKVSESEYTSANMAAFRRMDKDRDGKINGIELTEAEPSSSGASSPLSSAQISEIDANKDLQVTAAEVSSGAARMFKNLDTNGDGFLSAGELSARKYRSESEASADSKRSGTQDSRTSANNEGKR